MCAMRCTDVYKRQAKDMAQMNESLDGEFDGIGVMFNMATDTVIVLNVINSGPSSKVGVLGGDRIITINDTVCLLYTSRCV